MTQAAEEIIYLPLNELHPFPHHPFKVQDDEQIKKRQKASGSRVFLFPASSDLARKEDMRSFRGIGANVPANWLD